MSYITFTFTSFYFDNFWYYCILLVGGYTKTVHFWIRTGGQKEDRSNHFHGNQIIIPEVLVSEPLHHQRKGFSSPFSPSKETFPAFFLDMACEKPTLRFINLTRCICTALDLRHNSYLIIQISSSMSFGGLKKIYKCPCDAFSLTLNICTAIKPLWDWISYDHSLIWPRDIWPRTFDHPKILWHLTAVTLDRGTFDRKWHLTAGHLTASDIWPRDIWPQWHLTAGRLTASDIWPRDIWPRDIWPRDIWPRDIWPQWHLTAGHLTASDIWPRDVWPQVTFDRGIFWPSTKIKITLFFVKSCIDRQGFFLLLLAKHEGMNEFCFL